MPEVIDLVSKFALFSDHWHPRIIAELNHSHVKLAKLHGEFIWHKHEQEDELFWVVKGSLQIKLRDRDLIVGEGQLVVIPKGVEHLPVAAEETLVVLIEPVSTVNTGDARSDRTREPDWL
jgi:mannose-6-phosphate isomerase-like protein (cupin superfamily)